jgi:hypothetical protein
MNEMPSAIIQTTPRARKEHKCCECRGIIHPGEKYHRTWGVWNAEVSTFKTCNECEALRGLIGKERAWDELPYYGGIMEDVRESQVPEWDAALREILLRRNVELPRWLKERVKA